MNPNPWMVALGYALLIIATFGAMVAALVSAFNDGGQLRAERKHFIPTPVVDMVMSHRWTPKHVRRFGS